MGPRLLHSTCYLGSILKETYHIRATGAMLKLCSQISRTTVGTDMMLSASLGINESRGAPINSKPTAGAVPTFDEAQDVLLCSPWVGK